MDSKAWRIATSYVGRSPNICIMGKCLTLKCFYLVFKDKIYFVLDKEHILN